MISEIEELKFEITDRCNSKCTFCHHGNFRSQPAQDMNFEVANRWFSWAKNEGVISIRFTGGEPTLHPDILLFCKTAMAKGLLVSLNSNGFSSVSLYQNIFPFLDEIKISLPHPDPVFLDQLTGVKNSLTKKLNTIIAAITYGLKTEILSAMIPENIGLIKEYLIFIKDIPGLTWCPLRIEPSSENSRPISRAQIQTLAEELKRCREEYPELNVKLRLAAPFCAVQPIELGAEVFSGRCEDCGPFKSLTVDSSGNMISCYSCRNPIKTSGNLDNIRQDKAIVHLISTNSLPLKCQKCKYVELCMGGCQSPYAIQKSDGGYVDYLALES